MHGMIVLGLGVGVVLALSPVTRAEEPRSCDSLFRLAVTSIARSGRWEVVKAYRAVRELPPKSIRELQSGSRSTAEERALGCGLVEGFGFQHFMTDAERDQVVFACEFPPLGEGAEWLRACRGRIITGRGARAVYVRSYRDVEGDELYEWRLAIQ